MNKKYNRYDIGLNNGLDLMILRLSELMVKKEEKLK